MYYITRKADISVYRISANDTNKFALLGGVGVAHLPFVACLEIFDPGGRTPPNVHHIAHEFFYVIEGRGRVVSVKDEFIIENGMSFTLVPGTPHSIFNMSQGKLYLLTFMVPDENFLSLIKSGIRDSLDEDDLQVIEGY